MSTFKTNKISGHPAYIYERENDKYNFFRMTSNKDDRDKKGKTLKKIKLNNNPDPKSNKDSFVILPTKQQPIKSFKDESKYKDWKMSKIDKERLKKHQKQKKSGV